MRHVWIVFLALLIAAPQAHAIGTPSAALTSEQQPAKDDQSVEEPDAPDEDSAVPATQVPGQTEQQPATATPDTTPVPAQEKPPEEGGDTHFERVLLRGLNKVTARAEPIDATLGSVVRFGTIEIIAHRCWKAAPEERPENAALLEISEIKQGEAPTTIFQGWMFSSTPGISALEHPFYDVSVVKCEKAAAPEAPPAKPAAKPAAASKSSKKKAP